MQPGYPGPGQDPYGQQPPHTDPYAQPQYSPQQPQPEQPQQPRPEQPEQPEPHQQPEPPAYPPPGQQSEQPPQYQDPYAQPTSGGPYPPSGTGYPPSGTGYPPSGTGYPSATPYPQAGYGAPMGAPPQPAGNDKTILWGVLGIIFALPFCCFPIGVVFAILSLNEAKKAGKQPTLAYVAFGIAALSLVIAVIAGADAFMQGLNQGLSQP
jgi:hypothetical protein